jgi:uncharacterized protein YajQ (UPF0234 family)
MPSFDVVSKLDHHEVDNAFQQAQKEIAQRYDFKDTQTSLEKNQDGIVFRSSTEDRIDAARGVLEDKFARRKVSLKALDPQKIEQAGGQMFRQLVKLKEGVEMEKAKEIVKTIKDAKLKVQGAIQGDLVRVSGKKRDDLQEAIALLRGKDFGLPLQFTNFRE